ncbi:MAG: endonuclease/exonuclease/phosphatase family protein [bacterium]
MIDRAEIFWSRVRRLVSRHSWTARILGAKPVVGHADEPGLVLIQVDGLGEAVLRRALAEGKMPFLRHLVEDEGYGVHRLYSGVPSNTPAFQAELFWGVPGVVPGFGFRDPETGRAVWMTQRGTAARVEEQLAAEHEGLLRGGSAWSDIYSGGAAEPRFCSSTAGVSDLLRELSPGRLVGLLVWHGWSVVRVLANIVAETGLALWDFARGAIAGRDLAAEFRFIGERVGVTAVLREIITAGACVDADRGLPIVHLNYLGYDEHAHRRGPDSGFALWALQGIDASIRRVWLAAHRSRHRDYQVWIYSDHGQETVTAYRPRYGETIEVAARRAWDAWKAGREAQPRPENPAAGASERFVRAERRGHRTAAMREELPDWMRRWKERPGEEPAPVAEEGEPFVLERGPIGFMYLPEGERDFETRRAVAARVAREGRSPTVLVATEDGGAIAFPDDGGEIRLPGEEEALLGPDHPHREAVVQDLLRLVHHELSGELVLLSWHPARPMSFNVVNGAHGGPGPRETTAFLVTPPETNESVPRHRLRASGLRELARDVLDPTRANLRRHRMRAVSGTSDRLLRIATYNVHGCRGMDGRYSVERIARTLARLAPDVVCLQELDLQRARSGGLDQGREIAQRLETDYFSHAVREADDGLFGNAVLSTLPVRLVAAGPLPALDTRLDLEPRGVLWVEIDLDGIPVQVFNTHLSILSRERRLQVQELLSERWLGHPDCTGPVILLGDFNAATDSWCSHRLAERVPNIVDQEIELPGPRSPIRPTWSGRLPVRRIDHVFASEHFRVRRVDAPRNRLTRVASDHLPLVVDLSIDSSSLVPQSGVSRRNWSETSESRT